VNPRRSSRSKVTPTWLKDFYQHQKHDKAASQSSQSHSLHNAVTYPLLKAEDFTHLSNDYVASLMTIMQTPKPHSYS